MDREKKKSPECPQKKLEHSTKADEDIDHRSSQRKWMKMDILLVLEKKKKSVPRRDEYM